MIRLNDRPNMTIAVYRGRKAKNNFFTLLLWIIFFSKAEAVDTRQKGDYVLEIILIHTCMSTIRNICTLSTASIGFI